VRYNDREENWKVNKKGEKRCKSAALCAVVRAVSQNKESEIESQSCMFACVEAPML
jgi:hypothetical protein